MLSGIFIDGIPVFFNFLGKADGNIITRMDEHGMKPDQPTYQHLTNCTQFAEYLKFYALPDLDVVNNIVSRELHLHNAVTENIDIIDHSDSWAQLQYLETNYIKTMAPETNIGLKASRKL